MVGKAESSFKLRIDGKWYNISKEFLQKHPGGSVITQYKDSDATHIFHAFHEGSEKAYKQLKGLQRTALIDPQPHPDSTEIIQQEDEADVNVAKYDISLEQEQKIVRGFEKLRQEMHSEGLMKENNEFYISKTFEVLGIVALAFLLQYWQWYILSACVLALAWQQFGWLCHEYCHHQPMKNRHANDTMSLFLGNIMQGFSRDWWKEKHNTHHAATNIIDHDGDIDLTPLMAFVPDDLKKYKLVLETPFLNFIPYQHIYFAAVIPLLRISWTLQSIVFVSTANRNFYRSHRKHATIEQIGIALHWLWVFFQLWLLPTNSIRVLYFLISQLGGGLLIGHVVTFSHNSVDKFPANSRLLNNFACLHILTTRNMDPSPFVDWLWGGLNYQIEHHLFPTMPRPNLNRASHMVRRFCEEHDLPYLSDGYFAGFKKNLDQLANIAHLARKIGAKMSSAPDSLAAVIAADMLPAEHSRFERSYADSGADSSMSAQPAQDAPDANPFYYYPAMIQAETGHFRSLFLANKAKVIVYCAVFWSFGMCVGFLGPTLWDLGCQTATVIPTMAWVFFSQSLFMLIGSLLAGFLIKRFTAHPVLLAGMVGITLTFVLIPSCSDLSALGFVLAIMGFSMGLIDTTANVSMISVFGSDVSPFLQALHFFYGLGAFLSPLIAEPFLKNFDCTTLIDNHTAATGWIEKAMSGMEAENPKSVHIPGSLREAQKDIRINDAFWIMALMQIPILIGVIMLVVKERLVDNQTMKLPAQAKSYDDLDKTVDTAHNPWAGGTAAVGENANRPQSGTMSLFGESRTLTTLVLLGSGLLFFADGMQAAFGDYVFSYGKLTIPGLVISDAALVNAGFWGAFALGRLLSIFVSVYVSPGFLLFVDVAGSLFAVLVIFFFRESLKALYVGTLLFGLFLSSVYPSTISTVEQFVNVGPSATSILVVGAAAGEMVYPVTIGKLLDRNGPWVFPFWAVISVALMACLLIALLYFGISANKTAATQNVFKLLFPQAFKQKTNEESTPSYNISRVNPTAYKKFNSEESVTPDDGPKTYQF
uniref:Cytochrome b5 heme-binding domain-containing protein n=1 Tax=Plectus sambesii TaxID=2011161 RepID=A0A914WC67_9BILA